MNLILKSNDLSFYKSSDAVVDCKVGIRNGNESWKHSNEMMCGGQF